MMDALNGNNIQCFFIPSNIDSQTLKIQYKTTNRKFDFEEKLPYKSCAYDYSDHFIIFDYERNPKDMDTLWVSVIENGVCTYYTPPEALTDSYPIVLVINKYGIPLNITKISDFKKIKTDYILLNKKINTYQGLSNKDELIEAEKMKFEYKWYNFKMLENVYSNIVGILLSIYAINPKFKIKEIFKKYCEKHNLDMMREISEYHTWANLHEIELDKKELEDALL